MQEVMLGPAPPPPVRPCRVLLLPPIAQEQQALRVKTAQRLKKNVKVSAWTERRPFE